MYLTGFADEGAKDLAGQIRATKTLGWKYIEARNVDGTQFTDLPDDQFDAACRQLDEAGVGVNCFGSAIANWGKHIDQPFDTSLAEARRAIPRMMRLGTKLIRVMSFAVLKDREPEDQMADERFRRMRELQKMFADEGLILVHENCMNYGGMGWTYTLKLLENVPGLRLVFDTGNPVFTEDRTKPAPRPQQSAWEFYEKVRDHIEYVHIKDGIWHADTKAAEFTYPGEGVGDVKRIVKDLLQRNYDGGFSMEPHLKVVAHDESVQATEKAKFDAYVEYGRRFEKILAEAKAKVGR